MIIYHFPSFLLFPAFLLDYVVVSSFLLISIAVPLATVKIYCSGFQSTFSSLLPVYMLNKQVLRQISESCQSRSFIYDKISLCSRHIFILINISYLQLLKKTLEKQETKDLSKVEIWSLRKVFHVINQSFYCSLNHLKQSYETSMFIVFTIFKCQT